MDWIYENRPVTDLLISNNDYYGFVYLITAPTGKRYVGRKYLHSLRRVRGSRRRVRVESNWRHYYGSCFELKEDIKRLGKEKFEREILSFHKSRCEVNYAETRELFIRDVLTKRDSNGELLYYNSNILGRYYRSHFLRG